AAVEMPIAGLMSDERAEVVAAKAEAVLAEYRACGCSLNNAIMQMSLLALVVIPELRISDLGLVDVTQFKPVDVLGESCKERAAGYTENISWRAALSAPPCHKERKQFYANELKG